MPEQMSDETILQVAEKRTGRRLSDRIQGDIELALHRGHTEVRQYLGAALGALRAAESRRDDQRRKSDPPRTHLIRV